MVRRGPTVPALVACAMGRGEFQGPSPSAKCCGTQRHLTMISHKTSATLSPRRPNTERSVQNAEASIVDAFVRSVFGWRPDWDFAHRAACTLATGPAPVGCPPRAPAAERNPRSAARVEIDRALFLPHVPRRGFSGVLPTAGRERCT